MPMSVSFFASPVEAACADGRQRKTSSFATLSLLQGLSGAGPPKTS